MKTYRLLIFSLSTACCVLPCAAQTPALESNSVIRITPHRSELNGTVQVARFRSFSADTLIYTDSNQAGTEYRIRRDQIQRLELRTSGGRNTGKGLKYGSIIGAGAGFVAAVVSMKSDDCDGDEVCEAVNDGLEGLLWGPVLFAGTAGGAIAGAAVGAAIGFASRSTSWTLVRF